MTHPAVLALALFLTPAALAAESIRVDPATLRLEGPAAVAGLEAPHIWGEVKVCWPGESQRPLLARLSQKPRHAADRSANFATVFMLRAVPASAAGMRSFVSAIPSP